MKIEFEFEYKERRDILDKNMENIRTLNADRDLNWCDGCKENLIMKPICFGRNWHKISLGLRDWQKYIIIPNLDNVNEEYIHSFNKALECKRKSFRGTPISCICFNTTCMHCPIKDRKYVTR